MKVLYTPLLLFIVLITGCIHFHNQVIDPEVTWRQFTQRNLEQPELLVYLHDHLPEDQSVESADNLKTWTIRRLTLAAFFYNPELQVIRSQLAVAKGQEVLASQRPNPVLSLSPGFNSTTLASSGVSQWMLDSAVEVPWQTAGKRGYQMAQARHLSEAVCCDVLTEAWKIRDQITEACYDIYAARKREKLLSKQIDIQTNNLQLINQQMQLGEVSSFQVSQRRIDLAGARLEMQDIIRQELKGRARLAEAIGIPLNALDMIQFDFDPLDQLPGNLPDGIARRWTLQSRSDLLKLLAEYQASQSHLQLEIARQYPDIQIGPGYSFDQDDNKWILGLAITLPVLNRNQGGIMTAEAQRQAIKSNFLALQAHITGQIDYALADYQACRKKLQVASNLSDELTQKYHLVQQMYDAGEISKLQVSSIQLEQIHNDRVSLNVKIECLYAWAKVESVMQTSVDLPQWRQIIQEKTSKEVDPNNN